MKVKTLKISRILVTTLFSMVTTLILYESVCPANMSAITPISDFIKDVINSINPPKEIPLEQLKINNKKEFIEPGIRTDIFYKLSPENATNTEIKFESLTPEYVDVYNQSFVCKNNTNNIQPQDSIGKIKAYSIDNPEIFDIYEFKIRKTHPNTLDVRSNLTLNSISNTYTAYINEEAYFDYDVKETDSKKAITYSSPVIVDYDENYFDQINNTKLIPTKLGETKIKVYSRDFSNLYKEFNVNIKSRSKLKEPKDITLFTYNDGKINYLKEDEEPLVYKKWEFAILDENKNKIDVPFKIKLNIHNDFPYKTCEIFNDNWIKFIRRKEVSLEAEFLGQYEGIKLSKTFTPKHIYSTPVVTSKNLDLSTMSLTLPKYSSEFINVNFTSGTYTSYYAKSNKPGIVKVINQSGIRLKGLAGGSAIITVFPMDEYAETRGFKPVSIKVTVTTPMFENEQEFGIRFRKSIGHMMGFLIDAILFILLINFWLDGKKRNWIIGLSLPIGFIFAGLTELLQFIQPTRGPSFMDVGIDMIGWAIGSLITIIILLIIYFVKCKNKQSVKVNDCDK